MKNSHWTTRQFTEKVHVAIISLVFTTEEKVGQDADKIQEEKKKKMLCLKGRKTPVHFTRSWAESYRASVLGHPKAGVW